MDISANFTEFIQKNPHVKFISELNKSIKEVGLTMVYEGVVDQTVVRLTAGAVERKMIEEKETSKMQKLIFHIVIELLQNISKYSDDEIKSKGIVIVGTTAKQYFVSSGNVIRNSKVQLVSSLIDTVNRMDIEQLQKLYETEIANRAFNGKGGAGLGLIDIARKSRQKIEYNFEALDKNTSFFLITASVLKPESLKTMENLVIQPTEDTPRVEFDAATNTMQLSGKSYPDNVFSFYESAMTWLSEYALHPKPGTKFIFKLDYFNTASAKIIFDMLSILDGIHEKGNPVNVLWYYKNGDDDMKEAAEGFARIIGTKIEIISY